MQNMSLNLIPGTIKSLFSVDKQFKYQIYFGQANISEIRSFLAASIQPYHFQALIHTQTRTNVTFSNFLKQKS